MHNLGARLRRVVSFTLQPPFPRGRNHRCPLGGSHRWSGRGAEEKNPCPYPVGLYYNNNNNNCATYLDDSHGQKIIMGVKLSLSLRGAGDKYLT